MINFSITTPERTLISEQVDSVTLPTQMGQITILQNHIPLVANLVSGEVKYKGAGGEGIFAVSGGFIEVKDKNQVIVLADTAEFGHEIDVLRAERARDDARKLMDESQRDTESFFEAAALLEKNI